MYIYNSYLFRIRKAAEEALHRGDGLTYQFLIMLEADIIRDAKRKRKYKKYIKLLDS